MKIDAGKTEVWQARGGGAAAGGWDILIYGSLSHSLSVVSKELSVSTKLNVLFNFHPTHTRNCVKVSAIWDYIKIINDKGSIIC